MKKIFIPLVLIQLGSVQAGYSQERASSGNASSVFNSQAHTSEKFYLTGPVTSGKEQFYKMAIALADMENYRLREKEVILEFEEGFKCVLPSAKQLIIKGHNVDPNRYQENFPVGFLLPVFSIKSDGQLIAKYEKVFK